MHKLVATLLIILLLTTACQREIVTDRQPASIVSEQPAEHKELQPQKLPGPSNTEDTPAQQEAEDESAARTITDIAAWEHPIKKYFEEMRLTKIEFPTKDYPVFYLDYNVSFFDELVAGNLEAMLKANGYWSFEIRTREQRIRVVSNDRRSLANIYVNDEPMDWKKIKKDYSLIIEELNARIIAKDAATGYYYFRDPYEKNDKPPEDPMDLFLPYYISYRFTDGMFDIMLPRSTDTVVSNLSATIEDGKPEFDYKEDFSQVVRLFADTFKFIQSKSTRGLYAGKDNERQYIYKISCSNYLLSERLYVIQVTGTADNTKSIYYYDADHHQFYRDSSRMPIEGDDIILQ